MSAGETTGQKETQNEEPTLKCLPANLDMPMQLINSLNADLNQVKTDLEGYALHLRSLGHKRRGVSMRNKGFIDRATECAMENPEFLPHFLTLEKLRKDGEYFNDFSALFDLAWKIQDLLWDITIEISDLRYADAMEYYASVCKAAKRRIDVAESIRLDLEQLFKKRRTNARAKVADTQI